jgi:hypothetical protein
VFRPRLFALTLLSTAALANPGFAQAESSSIRITFVAKADSFSTAAREYEQIWAADGRRIVSTMERVAGLSFRYQQFHDTAIAASVLEGVSNSGFRNRSGMQLRASYPADTKRATLIHELGHRLMAGLYTRDEAEHGPLFLWLYDVWVAMYGKSFADAQVEIERSRGGPYPAAWDAAMKLTASERAAKWREVLAERLPRRQ